MKKPIIYGLLLSVLLVGLLSPASAQDETPVEAMTPDEYCESAEITEPETRQFEQYEMVLEEGLNYQAIFCTDKGAIYVDLFEDYTPVTVNSFVFLAQNGFYNNTVFHRVIADFMAQGGDPTATGAGGPGYEFEDEPVGFLHFTDMAGWLAMANAGPGTNGSQFFITTVPYPSLNYKHTIFGRVLEGQDVVESIPDNQADPTLQTPLNTIIIITDPLTVETTYTPGDRAIRQEIKSALYEPMEQLPKDVFSINEDKTQAYQAEEALATFPRLADYFTQHNLDYRVIISIDNSACNLAEYLVTSISYTVDAFGSGEDGTAAIADYPLPDILQEAGYEEYNSEYLRYPYYMMAESACDADVFHGVTYWQRGRYVITAEVVIPADQVSFVDLLLQDYAAPGLFETFLQDAFLAEIR